MPEKNVNFALKSLQNSDFFLITISLFPRGAHFLHTLAAFQFPFQIAKWRKGAVIKANPCLLSFKGSF